MFNSGLTAYELIESIEKEADISEPIPRESYIQWLNAIEQVLYTELIKEQGRIELTAVSDTVVDVNTLMMPDGEDRLRFEDILAIYSDDTQLIKSTVASGVIFPNTYYKICGNIGLNLEEKPDVLRIIYTVRPALKTKVNIGTEYVRVPVEFIDLIKAKLRGEAYKAVNEDALGAKWLSDYNVLLETFKTWLSEKQPAFGL